jgi:hypothetical protein
MLHLGFLLKQAVIRMDIAMNSEFRPVLELAKEARVTPQYDCSNG